MSETDDRPQDGEERDHTDPSELSDEGVGATLTDEPNTMEPEEGLAGDEA